MQCFGQIRLRRLERLQAGSSTNSSVSPSPSPAPTAEASTGATRPASALNRLNQSSPSPSASAPKQIATPAKPIAAKPSSSSLLNPSYYAPSVSTIRPPVSTASTSSPSASTSTSRPWPAYQSQSIISILDVSPSVLSSETTQGQVDIDSVDAVLIAMLSVESELTTFEYLTGCWKRLYRVNREVLKAVSRNELRGLGWVTDCTCGSVK
jgi:ubiquitin conjugation factor E4 B